VTETLRARVRAAAARLGYVPNLAARALATRRSELVAIIADCLADPVVAAVLAGCERGLAEAGYRVLVSAAPDSPDGSLAAAQDLLGRGGQALVLIRVSPSAEIVRLAGAYSAPCVTVGDDPAAEGATAVLSLGHREGAALATRYLVAAGHRWFGLIAPTRAMLAAVQEILAAGPPASAVAVAEGLDPAQATRNLLDRSDPPTAVLCSSDACALAALRECAIRGVAVPGRVSVVGFGDAQFARWAYPALSTIRVGAAEIGLRAARAVLAQLEGHDFLPLQAPIKLIARESTGPSGPSVSRGTK
jgi:DNA-binding LacI/PurR family transcriptional regulator